MPLGSSPYLATKGLFAVGEFHSEAGNGALVALISGRCKVFWRVRLKRDRSKVFATGGLPNGFCCEYLGFDK